MAKYEMLAPKRARTADVFTVAVSRLRKMRRADPGGFHAVCRLISRMDVEVEKKST